MTNLKKLLPCQENHRDRLLILLLTWERGRPLADAIIASLPALAVVILRKRAFVARQSELEALRLLLFVCLRSKSQNATIMDDICQMVDVAKLR